ncbi:hypothetical protein [Streptobacillus moniliformis]|uniref:Uncharacterized protein n=1 Tax=Streptobacillus moniliformis (strain ATCC 14647 / DSM 12112 / NCTC 10651 / 9901) TaxID=519441 RepID=D1AVY1_STRM9|nr:hypothetical protein [Streptobacillus moniliformis]ACZ01891.1 hypothetical protein Smon_1458 [Streptobacillus moniliformis DSM 12112]SQA12903.1 Uncharacterised protein [Streptobacillus moniliformis]
MQDRFKYFNLLIYIFIPIIVNLIVVDEVIFIEDKLQRRLFKLVLTTIYMLCLKLISFLIKKLKTKQCKEK